MTKVEEKVEKVILQSIEELGYELYDVEYIKEGKDYFLRIYIDSDKGITLEDCEKVSNHLTEILDKEDYIKEQYFLEISSPGIERTLRRDKHLKDNINNKIQIKLFKPIESKKHYIGKLMNFDNNNIKIDTELGPKSIDRKNISQIKTIYEWN